MNLWTTLIMNLWFANLWHDPFELNLLYKPLSFDIFDMITLIWYIWYDTFDKIPWYKIWYELFDLNLWYDMLFDPSVWYYEPNLFPSHEGNMDVSLMHQWHDSSVVEWCSTPSPFDMICALYELLWLLRLVCGGVWMHPRFVFCFEGYIMIRIWFGDWCVCNTCLSHYLGVATPTLEASPHVTFGIPRSPLRIHYIWFDLVWARSGLLFL